MYGCGGSAEGMVGGATDPPADNQVSAPDPFALAQEVWGCGKTKERAGRPSAGRWNVSAGVLCAVVKPQITIFHD